MKITYYDLFDLIAEDAGIMLAQSENSMIRPDLCDINETVHSVMEQAARSGSHTAKKKGTHRHRKMLRLLIAAILILSASGIAFAAYQYDLSRDGAALITDENRDLIGKDACLTWTVYDKDGNYVRGTPPAPEPTFQDIFGDSKIITSAADPDVLPHSVAWFQAEERNVCEVTPEVIFENGAMIVFTKADGSGWHLSEGDTLIFETETYPLDREPDKAQHVASCYVLDHTLMNNEIVPVTGPNLKYELTAEKTGEYYICFIGASSESISLKEGMIHIQTKDQR